LCQSLLPHNFGSRDDRLSGTVARRSRLFGTALRCFAFILSYFPRLTLFLLLQLPASVSTKRVRLAIANSLFQLDHPEQALQYLKRSSRFDQPTIEELFFQSVCLFQGLGLFRDAISQFACANERNVKAAAKVDLTSRYRVLDNLWARHIGDAAMLDYVIKLGILEGRHRDETIMYLPRGSVVANRFLLQQLAEHLRLVEDAGDLPFRAAAVQSMRYHYVFPRLPDGTTTFFWEVAAKTYKRWQEEERGPLLTLPPEITKRGWTALQRAGVPQNGWFVALHVREGRWQRAEDTLYGALNADIATYFPAIAEVTRRGGWVIRMGGADMRPLPRLANVFDYCHSDLRADWMDIFIAACSRFMIATSSGPAHVASIYGVPRVLTNWWPPAARPWHASDIFVPKMLRRSVDGRYLTLSEMLREPFSWCVSRRYLADHSRVHIENSDPEIIRGAVEEMFARLDGDSGQRAETAQLRARADSIYESHSVVGMGELARDFLRRHDDLIV
jgi:putative glycosyltransferase (TIGR04372 family)